MAHRLARGLGLGLRDRPWLLLPLLALPALWPFYREGLPRSFDGGIHLVRIALLGQYLDRGDLFPRWSPDLQLGLGYPVFSYYGPSTYYLVELIHRLGLNYYHAFTAAFVLLVLAAGGGAYLFARDGFGGRAWPALVTGVAYIYSPYLLTNVYIRGAIAEVGALALLPWIFWSGRRLLRSGQASLYVLPFALTLGCLAITHNITLLFVPPVLLGFMGIHWWQGGRDPRKLRWAAIAGLLAMGISAFFWLPLIAERRYLADTAYDIAKSVWLPLSVWTWDNFLDGGWTYEHTFARPIRLGLGQLLLAGAGFVLARRRDPEWLWLGLTTVTAGLLGGAWALPVWQSNDILPIAQFPWRLLSVMSLPLALFTGGLVAGLRSARATVWASVGVILLLIWNQAPRLDWIDVFDSQAPAITLPVTAQLELEKGADEGGQGNSSVQEFRPRWADQVLLLNPATAGKAGGQVHVELVRAGPRGLDAAVHADTPTALRFATFYFPGWRVWLDGVAQAVYPSTNLGLLTVDLPPGDHALALRWTGTALQHGAGWTSLAALVLLALAGLRQPRHRWLAAAPLLLLAYGLAAQLSRSALADVAAPPSAVTAPGLELLGYTVERAGPDLLTIYPYWQVHTRPPQGLTLGWQLLDENGLPVTDVEARPYFNAYDAANWPAGAIVDDAYWLPLPDGLPAGAYQLAVQPALDGSALNDEPTRVGPVTLTAAAQRVVDPPAHALAAAFGENVRLAGYDLTVNRRAVEPTRPTPPLVEPGDTLHYRLVWQATAPIYENYHAFVHLTDSSGRPLVQADQLPGPLFQPPAVWDRVRLFPDRYLLRIPDDAPGGLYWPYVGMYEFETVDRLSAYAEDGAPPGDHVPLPPVKIVRRDRAAPNHPVEGRFGDAIGLEGYDLTAPAELHAGDALELALHFRSLAVPDGDYTRFVQVYNPELGLAAQYDSPPQAGGNPTWTWQRGESIVDAVSLQVSADAAPGMYTVYVGFYDPAQGNAPLPAVDGDGTVIADDWLPLTEVQIVD